jgi:Domain of unknown function (DUF5664)
LSNRDDLAAAFHVPVEDVKHNTVDRADLKRQFDEVRVTSATGGVKGSKLARFDQLPADVLWELAEHFGKGGAKYGDSNWRKGYDWKYSYAALQRHLNLFWMGEDYDEETDSKHVIAAAWHCLALAWFMDHKPEYDFRFSDPGDSDDR